MQLMRNHTARYAAALLFTLSGFVYAGTDPFSDTGNPVPSPSDSGISSSKLSDSKAVTRSNKAGNNPQNSVKKPNAASSSKVDKPSSVDKPTITTDSSFRMNAEGYLIIGNNTYRLRSISGTLMAGGLCTITVYGDIVRSFNGSWTGSIQKPTISISSSDIGKKVDGRGIVTFNVRTVVSVGFAGAVNNDYYRVKMPVAKNEGGYWLNGRWQDNRDGSVLLSNPPDKPYNSGQNVLPSDYWSGVCRGTMQAYASDFSTRADSFTLDGRQSDRVVLTATNSRSGEKWVVYGTIRTRVGNSWELEPYMINNIPVDGGRWWVEFAPFRRTVARLDVSGDTSRGGFRIFLQQTTR